MGALLPGYLGSHVGDTDHERPQDKQDLKGHLTHNSLHT